jgi:SPRY domain/F5/8 type C domain
MPVVTWDSVNKGSGVTLSNGDLTATVPNLSNTARATISKNSGKWYWEIKFDSGSNAMIGIVNSSAGVGKTMDNVNAMYYYNSTGSKWNSTGSAYGASYSAGDIISVLLDLDNGTIEFWKNGVSQGVAFANVRSLGDVYPAVTSGSSTVGGIFTANFGASPFVYNIPKGYYSYDGSQYGAINKILILSSDGEYKTMKFGDPEVNLIPVMTSNTTPRGEVSASSVYSSNYAWKAFDRVNTDGGWLSDGTTNQWLAYKFDEPKVISKYTIEFTASLNIGTAPKTWTFEGSNDGANWIVLDTRTDIIDWVKNAKKEFLFDNKNPYLYYRIFILTNNGGANYIHIGEMEMMDINNIVNSIKIENITEQDISTYGMNSQNIDVTKKFGLKKYTTTSNSALGSGKTFEQTLDLSKHVVNKIRFDL